MPRGQYVRKSRQHASVLQDASLDTSEGQAQRSARPARGVPKAAPRRNSGAPRQRQARGQASRSGQPNQTGDSATRRSKAPPEIPAKTGDSGAGLVSAVEEVIERCNVQKIGRYFVYSVPVTAMHKLMAAASEEQ